MLCSQNSIFYFQYWTNIVCCVFQNSVSMNKQWPIFCNPHFKFSIIFAKMAISSKMERDSTSLSTFRSVFKNLLWEIYYQEIYYQDLMWHSKTLRNSLYFLLTKKSMCYNPLSGDRKYINLEIFFFLGRIDLCSKEILLFWKEFILFWKK